MSINSYEGSQNNPSLVGTTATILPSMTENGWRFGDWSNPVKTYWQFVKPLENGRYNEITLEEHKIEGVHIKLKIMLKKEEKPTKEQFINLIAPQLRNGVKKTLIMKLCSHCGSEIPFDSKFCPNCGNASVE
jgi:hypothetical protein